MVKINIISSLITEDPIRDLSFSRHISEMHIKDGLDALFLSKDSRYPLLRDYCSSNQTSQINCIHIKKRTAEDCLKELIDYVDYAGQRLNIAYISEENNLPSLKRLLEKSKFEIEESRITI